MKESKDWNFECVSFHNVPSDLTCWTLNFQSPNLSQIVFWGVLLKSLPILPIPITKAPPVTERRIPATAATQRAASGSADDNWVPGHPPGDGEKHHIISYPKCSFEMVIICYNMLKYNLMGTCLKIDGPIMSNSLSIWWNDVEKMCWWMSPVAVSSIPSARCNTCQSLRIFSGGGGWRFEVGKKLCSRCFCWGLQTV